MIVVMVVMLVIVVVIVIVILVVLVLRVLHLEVGDQDQEVQQEGGEMKHQQVQLDQHHHQLEKVDQDRDQGGEHQNRLKDHK